MIKLKILNNPSRFHLDFLPGDINYPVKVFFLNKNGTISWQTQVENHGIWVQGPTTIDLNIRILDKNDDLVFLYDSIYSELSDVVEKTFINWCRSFIASNGIKPTGLAIGTNDGAFGEWVEAYNQNLIGTTLLVEPNLNAFLQLTTRYSNSQIFKFKKCAVSDVDGEVVFYTDPKQTSEVSSLSHEHCLKHNYNFDSITVKSFTPKTLIGNNIPDWIHIDAEGYDGKIILLFDDEILNKTKFILWEHLHLKTEESELIFQRLNNFGFQIIKGSAYNTCAFKMA